MKNGCEMKGPRADRLRIKNGCETKGQEPKGHERNGSD